MKWRREPPTDETQHALVGVVAELIIERDNLETTIQLMRQALTHALCGREDDAWAIISELGGNQR